MTDPTGTTVYRYDVEDRLVEISGPAGTTTYTYDADWNRVARTDATGTVRYLIDMNRRLAQVLAEYTPAGTLIASYTYGSDLLSLSRAGQTRFYHADGLGSTRLLSDLDGGVTDTYDYAAFGSFAARTGATGNPFLLPDSKPIRTPISITCGPGTTSRPPAGLSSGTRWRASPRILRASMRICTAPLIR